MRTIIGKPKSIPVTILLVALMASNTVFAKEARNAQPEVKTAEEHVTAEEVKSEIGDAYEAIRGFSYAKKGDFQQWASSRISNLEPKLQNLKDHFADLDDRVKDKWKTNILPRLQNHTDAVKTKLKALKTSSGKAWPYLKWGVIEALGTLEDSFEDAAKEFRKDMREDSASERGQDTEESKTVSKD